MVRYCKLIETCTCKTHTCTHAYMRTHTHTCTHIHTCIHTHARTHTHTHTHTHTRTHTHTGLLLFGLFKAGALLVDEDYEFNASAALLFGTIVAAVDPVAVSGHSHAHTHTHTHTHTRP